MYGGNVVRVLVHFFSIAAHFVLELVAASISLFTSPPQTKTLCCSFNKKMSPLFFISRSRSVALFLVEFRWPSVYFLFFSVFLLLLFQICGHDN